MGKHIRERDIVVHKKLTGSIRTLGKTQKGGGSALRGASGALTLSGGPVIQIPRLLLSTAAAAALLVRHSGPEYNAGESEV
jgi:hypothetical protein